MVPPAVRYGVLSKRANRTLYKLSPVERVFEDAPLDPDAAACVAEPLRSTQFALADPVIDRPVRKPHAGRALLDVQVNWFELLGDSFLTDALS